MTLNIKNQNDILEAFGIDSIYENIPINRVNKEKIFIGKDEMLKNLRNKILNIRNCDLKKNSKNIVFGDGNINSYLMIIGEGPGQKEDELGKPFVGEAGLLLNKMLKAININRENVYITNVVNYRPPNNRKPEKNEILKYSEFLKEHISIINPKIIVLLGSTAMESLLGGKIRISKERGKWKEFILNKKKYKLIISFHPAYLLRQPDQKKYSWEDLKNLRIEIDKQNIKI